MKETITIMARAKHICWKSIRSLELAVSHFMFYIDGFMTIIYNVYAVDNVMDSAKSKVDAGFVIHDAI